MAWIRSNAFKKNFWCHFIWLWNGLCNSWSSVSWRIEVGALLQTLSSGKGCPGHVGASVTRYVCLGPFQVCLTIITITTIIVIITTIVITLITQSKERWRGGKGTATWKTRMEQHWFFPVMILVSDRITESYFNYSQDEMDLVCCKGGGEHELVHKQGLSLCLSPDISSNFSWKVYCPKRCMTRVAPTNSRLVINNTPHFNTIAASQTSSSWRSSTWWCSHTSACSGYGRPSTSLSPSTRWWWW